MICVNTSSSAPLLFFNQLHNIPECQGPPHVFDTSPLVDMLFPISRYPRKINGATDTFPHICGWGPGGKDGLLHLARRNQSVRIKTREEAEVLRGPLRLPPQHPLCLRLSLRAPRGRCGPSGLGLGAVGPSLSRLRPCLSGCRAATASE